MPFGPDGRRVSNLWAHARRRSGRGQAARLRRPHRRRADRPARRSGRSDPFTPTHPRRQALRPRRRRHEELDRGDGRRRRGVRRGASPDHAGAPRLADHQRRGRPVASTARCASATGWPRAASGSTTASSASRPRSRRCGDMIKNGRRGTLSGKLTRRAACRATSPIRTWRRTRSTWPRRLLAELVAHDRSGTRGNDALPADQLADRRTSMPAPAPATSSRARSVIDFNFRFSHRVDARVAARARAGGARCATAVELRRSPGRSAASPSSRRPAR